VLGGDLASLIERNLCDKPFLSQNLKIAINFEATRAIKIWFELVKVFKLKLLLNEKKAFH